MACILIGAFFTVAALVGGGRAAHLQNNQTALFDYLFNPNTSRWLRTFPICDDKNASMEFTLDDYITSRNQSLLQVQLLIYFNQLSGLDEKEQSVQAKFSFVMKWKDCRLRWPASRFAGIKQIVMNAREANIFIPVVSLEERLEDDINWTESAITIRHDGSVTLQKTDSLLFACDVDVRMYPFDSQDCQTTFRARTYDLGHLNITAHVIDVGEKSHLDNYIDSDTWTMVADSCKSSTYWSEVGVSSSKADADESSAEMAAGGIASVRIRRKEYAQVEYKMTFQRQPFYEVVNLILPAVVIVVISGCVFFIPPGVTDKVGLTLTILLGMFVFTQIMYDKMPESGSTLPLLSLYFLICIAMICGSCILAVFTSNISERRETCIHPFLHRVFLNWLGPRLRPDLFRTSAQRRAHRARLLSNLQDGERGYRKCGDNTHEGSAETEKGEAAAHQHSESEEQLTIENVCDTMRNEWLLLAQVFDRLFLIVHMSVTLLLFIMFMLAGIIHMFA